MAQRGYSRKSRTGQTFRPGHRQTFKPKRSALQARLAATAVRPTMDTEPVFNAQHEEEIQKAENIAAGLPPDTPDEAVALIAETKAQKAGETSVQEKPPEAEVSQPSGESAEEVKLVDKLRATTQKVVRKVKKLVRLKTRPHKEIIVNAEALETRVAILVDGKLEDFSIERTNTERLVGSIFKGKVRNLDEGLKAAFVDIGYDKNAFLHYWDIIPATFDSSVEVVERAGRKRERPRITLKDIPRLYPPGSDIVVQVSKGQIGTKGPRVTTHLAIPGRFLVLLPNSDQSGISRKIEDPEERQRLKKIVRKLNVPEGMGIIIRTAGQGQQFRYFVRELAFLLEEWRQIQKRIQELPAPACVFREPDLVERTVRDFLTEDVERIIVDDYRQYERIKELIGRISKRGVKKVMLYTDPQPIFDRFNVTRQLESAFARKVQLPSGGHLIIDETEALVAIDVNTSRSTWRPPTKSAVSSDYGTSAV